ncbi:AAA family ATPase [Saccharomycopsis crataegensis]|uniref:Vesicular-fusion protein SEC18 n=1 Tax=Saccharomycopsis crataegensis TaxID=43959 RepID=A0AAV5QHJ7_9ASCO|nr:AAA family ATPase [Saccharomycopsis crataegensis]
MNRFGFGTNNTPANNGAAPKGFSSPTSGRIAPPSSGQAQTLFVANSPNNQIALSGCVATNNFPSGSLVIIDDTFVVTTVQSRELSPGQLGLNGSQRSWMQFSLNQSIQVQPYRVNAGNILSSVNMEINFRNKNKGTLIKDPFDQDDVQKHFISVFNDQVLQPTQQLLFDYKSLIFECYIKSIQVMNMTDMESGQQVNNFMSSISAKGILNQKTSINFFSNQQPQVPFKASATRMRPDAIIRPDFKFEDMGVGGLDNEFSQIFRRAFASRIFPPGLIDKLGINHVKGLLLYGPPGTGKTLIARKIGKLLNGSAEPKIVNGPEILSKYVGSSEENIRNLFKDAEAEYKQKQENSSLHIIIFDELDSVFKQRGSRGDGTGVGDNVVNQLLAKMDGVEQLNNILIIGMTNRIDLIDNALLRPGRFEVQVEIKLPDEKGRRQIFDIHAKKMKDNELLGNDIDFDKLAALTKNFSGAEIEGLVKSAASFAINKSIKVGTVANVDIKKVSAMKVSMNDFLMALEEVKPAFGVSEDDLKDTFNGGIIPYSNQINSIIKTGQTFINRIQDPNGNTNLLSILIHGPSGSGKTALASSIALNSQFPFIRMISSAQIVGMSESAKITYIDNAFRDAYKSPLNILVIDQIESLIEYVPIGPRFSNNILQVLKTLITKTPPKNRKLLIFVTTSSHSLVKNLDLLGSFDNDLAVPNLTNINDVSNVLRYLNYGKDDREREYVVNKIGKYLADTPLNIGIKKVLSDIETSKYTDDPLNELAELIVSNNNRY